MWRRNKSLFLSVVAILCIGFGYLFFFRIPLSYKKSAVRKELRKLQKDIKAYFSSSGRAIRDIQRQLRTNLDTERDRLERLVSEVEFSPGLSLGSAEPGLAYLKKLQQLNQEARQKANKSAVRIPPTLDPRGTDKKPSDTEAGELYLRLLMNRTIVETAIESGIETVKEIEHLELLKTSPAKFPPFLKQYRAKATVSGSLDAIAKFLNSLQRPGGEFLSLYSAVISREDSSLVGRIEVSALLIDEEGLLPEEMVRKKPKTPRRRRTIRERTPEQRRRTY